MPALNLAAPEVSSPLKLSFLNKESSLNSIAESNATANNYSSSEDEDFLEDSSFSSDDYENSQQPTSLLTNKEDGSQMKESILSENSKQKSLAKISKKMSVVLSDSEDENDVFT